MSPTFDSIEEASEHELGEILGYLSNRSEGDRPPVLVGGWAVYSYNTYSKSQDIDLILSSDDRTSLRYWLRNERDYSRKRRHRDGWHGATKDLGELGTIVVDIGSFERRYPLEGRDESLDFSLALDHHVTTRIAGTRFRIPTRSLLLLYKAKAAWDRTYRLANDISPPSPSRDEAKLVKDRADILALSDPSVDAPLDLSFLAAQLGRLDVLVDVLREGPEDPAAVERYGGLSQGDGVEAVVDILRQVGVGD